MSDAEIVRRAAALMRERALAADSEGWESWGNHVNGGDGAHIAAWRPEVALAVANMLEPFAMLAQADLLPSSRLPLAVARAYLGEDA